MQSLSWGGVVVKSRRQFRGWHWRACRAALWFLGRAFAAAASLDPRVAGEVTGWAEGLTVLLEVEPYGPYLALGKRDGSLHLLRRRPDPADLAIYFKNPAGAWRVLSGQIGIAPAYAEHRFCLAGDIAMGMSLVRCLNLVEAYLFPPVLSNRILKRPPQLRRSRLRIYTAAIFGF